MLAGQRTRFHVAGAHWDAKESPELSFKIAEKKKKPLQPESVFAFPVIGAVVWIDGTEVLTLEEGEPVPAREVWLVETRG